MSNYDTPQQIQDRKAVFARFARLQVIKEEQRRTRIQLNGPSTSSSVEHHYNTWRSDDAETEYRNKEMEYIIPYTEEFSSGPRKQPDEADATGSGNNADEIDDDSASTITEATVISNKDLVTQLSSLRNRRAKGRKFNGVPDDKTTPTTDSNGLSQPQRQPSAPSTCNEFELTSTIMPPTEISPSDSKPSVSVSEIKSRFFSDHRSNTSLPIYKQRKQIVDSINSYSVVIIEGATGCGKTTQVPTYILEDTILDRPLHTGAPLIYVTQPRRIAARSIAERVCAEHNWNLPSIVGYQVGLEKVIAPETVLVFCTAGVLLQKIIQEKSLKNYSHIIIDEAHERDSDTDLLMMMIRKLMFVEMPVFRLVIMSATMDIDKLKKYFTFKTSFGHKVETTPSYIHVGLSARSASNIQTVYLDTLRVSFGVCEQIPEFDIEQAELFEDCLRAAVKIIVEVVPRLDNYNEESKSTLVFLPGLAEISRLDRMIRVHEGSADFLDIIPLHSCLTVADQLKVFKPSRPGCRKVILATNIAESSITVQDVGFIVDFCLTKTLMKDTVTRFPTLKLLWATQDKCTQRSGRTGRCCPGKVFRMVPQAFFKQFREFAEPELLTAPLELSVLRVKNFQMGEIKGLFAIVMDPPPFNEIRTAVLELKQIGALAATYQGNLSDIDGDLTELGRVISALPIDVHLSKLIVIASLFDVLQDAIIVAACLSTNRSVVRYLYGNSLESYEIKLEWARGSDSDLFLSLDCYKEFKEYKENKQKHHAWLASWCSKNHFDERKLHDVDAMVKELTERLRNVNIYADDERPNQQRDVNMDTLMLKLAFCAAFYPNYFLTQSLDPERIKKELNGTFDPTRTVFMSGLPTSQVPIYKSQMIKEIRNCIDDEFDFIADCSRAYLVFDDDNSNRCPVGSERLKKAIEGDRYEVIQKSRTVPLAVYKALKLGETIDITIREYKDEVAVDRMNFYYRQKKQFASSIGSRLVPSCMKVLYSGQQADNSRLLDVDEKEYLEAYLKNPYIEVEFDEEQDDIDQHELFELETFESKQSEMCLNHEIYKPSYRRIKGPDSPIRMSFRSVLVKSTGFNVEVDSQSVNSVLLDPEYMEARRQMLVAATVTQSKSGRVMARDTTLMPNIRGFPTLMALLFAQYYRLIYNNELNCVAGAVFGIGWSSHGQQPLDRQYEIDLGFDIHINMDDIALINKARGMMSNLLKFTEVQNAGQPQLSLQDDLRKVLLTLMRRRRYPLIELDITPVHYRTAATAYMFTMDTHNMPEGILKEGDTRPFLPLMKYTRECPEGQLYERIRSNLEQLTKIGNDLEQVPQGGIKCFLCGNGQGHCFILGLNVEDHLRSEGHLKKLAEFEVFEAQFKSRQQQS
uniref:RNA helicase n=1 Tax=Aceria tosichella TaxID=561515 RepID=A0A6G1S5N1_9ACAR